MEPKEFIAAFLQVWETNPRNIFETSGAIQNLQTLSNSLEACQDKSDADIAAELKKWCRSYPKITQKIIAVLGERKIKSFHNLNTQTEDNSTKNQYPEITEILRTRVQKTQKDNDDIEG